MPTLSERTMVNSSTLKNGIRMRLHKDFIGIVLQIAG